MDGRERKDVRPGLTVAVVLKQDQRTGRLTRGVVKDFRYKPELIGSADEAALLSPCVLRLRRKVGERKWARASLMAEPRSPYLLSGSARDVWEHSIPAVDALRYSITFRNLREG